MHTSNKSERYKSPASVHSCAACGSNDARCIGALGALIWYRCRDCGTKWPDKAHNERHSENDK